MSGRNMPAVTCLFTNAQSVTNKLPELQAVVRNHAPQIIGLAESWCSSSIGDAVNSYNLFVTIDHLELVVGFCFTYILHCQLFHVRYYLI